MPVHYLINSVSPGSYLVKKVHLSINCYFWTSIFDQLTLNRIPNSFFLHWTLDGPQKIKNTLQTPCHLFWNKILPMDPKQGSLKTKKSPKIAENCITEVLKPAEHELGNGKFLRCINYTSIFTKTSTLILNLEIWFIRLFDVRITEIVMKNLHSTMLSRVWTPIFFSKIAI